MKSSSAAARFRLEPLEPRVFLSADGLGAAAVVSPEVLPGSEVESASEEQTPPASEAFSALIYDPAQTIDDIFEGVERAPNNTHHPDQANSETSEVTRSLHALSGPPGPFVVMQSPSEIVDGAPGVTHLDLFFSGSIAWSSVNKNNFVFRGPDNEIIPGMIQDVFDTDLSIPTQLRVVFTTPLSAAGTYTVEVPSEVVVNGQQLDQDGDGSVGEISDDRYSARIQVQPAFESGVTIITHGFTPSAPTWTFEMAEAILDRAAGGKAKHYGDPDGVPYGTLLTYDTATGRWANPSLAESSHVNTYRDNEEVVVVFQWSDASIIGNTSGDWVKAAADALFAALLDPRLPSAPGAHFTPGRSLTDLAFDPTVNPDNTQDLNFHFIGHSRGGVLNTLVSGQFAQAFGDKLKIDHMTSLDPHPAESIAFDDPWGEVDAAATDLPDGVVLPTFTNIRYRDNFFRHDGWYEADLDFNGVPVNGAINIDLTPELEDGPAGGYGSEHSDVHLWYFGTIAYGLVSNRGETYTPEMRAAWFAQEGHNQGFAASRIAGQVNRNIVEPWNPTTHNGYRGFKTEATLPYAFGGSPLLAEEIFNGDFSVSNSFTSVPGWNYSGGSFSNMSVALEILSGNRSLYLNPTNDGLVTVTGTATHNLLFIPDDVYAITMDVAVDAAATAKTIAISFDGEQTGLLDLDALPTSQPEFLVPDRFRFGAHTITLTVTGAGQNAPVVIDNIRFVRETLELTPAQQKLLLDPAHELKNSGTFITTQPSNDVELPIDKTLNQFFYNSPGPDIGTFLDFTETIAEYFATGTPTIEGLVQALRARAEELIGNDAVGIGGNDPFTISGGWYDVEQELRVDVEFDFNRVRTVPLDIAASLESVGLKIEAGLTLDVLAHLQLGFSFGIDQAGNSFIRMSGLSVDLSANAAGINAQAMLGLLGVNIASGSASLAAHFGATLIDPTPGDGKVTMADIPGGGLQALLNIPAPTGTLHVELPIMATYGSYTAPAGAKVAINDSDIFSLPPPTVTATGLSNLVDFSNLTPLQVVDFVKRLGDWIGTFRNSEFFELELPFTGGKTVGQWFDSGTAFVDEIYKRLIRRELIATGTQSESFRTSGQLGTDAHFSITVGTDAPVLVTVTQFSTLENSSLEDAAADFNLALPAALAAKVELLVTDEGRLSLALRDDQTANILKLEPVSISDAIIAEVGFAVGQQSVVSPRFETIQEFATLLNSILAPFVFTPMFDPALKEVTMAIHFDWQKANTTPLNLSGSLGPLDSFTTSAEFDIAATVTFDLTLGFALRPKNTPQLITTAFVPPPSNGRLHDDSSFYVIIGTDAPVLVTVTAASTSSNTILAHLATTLNAALATAGLSQKVYVKLGSGTIGATHLVMAVVNEDLDADGHLDVAEDINNDGVLQVSEDIDGDGRLDVAEDTFNVNGTLDSLLGVQTLRIVANADDPIFTEVGFLPETARAESQGLFVNNAKISGSLAVSFTAIVADAQFSIFGIHVSDGSASGNVAFDVMLQNRAGTSRKVSLTELFAAANSDALDEVVSSSSGLGNPPELTGSLNITLGPTITITPPLMSLPADAQIIIAIPDITNLTDTNGEVLIHAGTDLVVSVNPVLPGIWLIYPKLGGLFHFSCLDIPGYIAALDALVQDLAQLSSFSFLNNDLPFINQSLTELIGHLATLGDWVNDIRANPGETLTELEAILEGALGINPSLLTFSVEDVPNPSLSASGTALFNPQGSNNALLFSNSSTNQITVRVFDDGNITADGAVASWDGANNILTIEVNSGVTTAEKVRLAVLGTASPVTATLNAADVGNDGSGVITKTAVRLDFNYALAFGMERNFELDLAELASMLPAGHPAIALLGGITAFIDVSGTGKLNISASASLNISFGLDLTNPCDPRPFFYDTTGLELKARVTATDLEFEAAASVLGVFVKGGSAALDGDGDASTADDVTFALGFIDHDGDGRHYFDDNFLNASNLGLTVVGGVGATLPLYFPVESLPLGGSAADGNADTYPDNYLVLSIPSLPNLFNGVPGSVIFITPDFSNLLGEIELCALLQSSGLLLDGLDQLLARIESGLNEIALSGNFPLVGDKLAKGANFIHTFRTGLLAELRRELDEADGSAVTLLENAIKRAFWTVLGPSALNVLVDPATGAALDPGLGFAQLDITVDCDDGLAVNLRLKKAIALVDTSADPIPIEIGVPSLGLEINGGVQIAIGFDLRLKFGINKEDGFYFDTANPTDTNFPVGGSTGIVGLPELIIYVEVTVPALDVTGNLFFLELKIEDGHERLSVGGVTTNPSHFTGRVIVDVMDSVGSGDRLTFADMSSGAFSFEDTFKAVLDLVAEVNLDLEITFGGNAAFPSIFAEFDLDWSWSNSGVADGTLDIAFNNITVDAGTFISNLLVPILKQVQKVTGPIEPIAQLLVTPIPGLSDLAGNDITLLDLAESFGYLKPSTRKFIETVINIVGIINDLAAATGSGDSLLFNLGNYAIAGASLPPDGSGVTALNWQGTALPHALSEPTGEMHALTTNALAEALDNLRELGFEFPILSLSEVFKMIQGQPATLVEYTMPTLEFNFSYSQSISLYPPFLTLVLGGEVSAKLDLTFGFDTYGILIYKESRNVLDILQGLYIKDTDGGGVDVPELVLSGGIFAGAAVGVSFGPVEVLIGVSGGLNIDLEFNLNDPDDDGKVRALEIVALAQQDIRCIFDIHGKIDLVLAVFLKVKALFFKFEKEWEFPPITLYEFDLYCPPPILAHYAGSELVLHIGPNAHLREEIDTNDNSEKIVVQHIGGVAGNETVLVKWNGYQKEFTGVSSIRADGGNGNDTIDARGIFSPVTISGGVGDDVIYASDNAANVIHGDAGHDTIVGSVKTPNILWGNDGNDTITGSPFADTLHGGAGNDIITANSGDDIVYGNDGNDTIYGGSGANQLYGGAGNDLLEGAEGADKLFGEDGNDKLIGGRGDDWLIGGAGSDTLDAGAGEDVLVGDVATIVSRLEVKDIAGAGDDLLIGGPGSDVLFGASGNDALFGGALMSSGVATAIEPDGVDFLDGGAGNDVLFADDAFAPIGVKPSGPTVKGVVWFDTNGDGIQASHEPGMTGVTVQLYDASTNVLEDSVVTNIAGKYQFFGLHAGDYYVTFVKLDTAQVFSTMDQGSDDSADSDADATSGQSPTFTLSSSGSFNADAGLRGPPVIVIDDVTQAEGTSSGSTAFVFTVSLSAPSASEVEVDYQVINGSAIAPGDFDATSLQTLTFTPGTMVMTITVQVNSENVYELAESFTVQLSNGREAGVPGVVIAKAIGQGLILNDDPIPSISIDDSSAVEATAGSVAKFTLHLSNPSSQPITVAWTTADLADVMGMIAPGTAHFGDDYTNATGSVTFAPGVTELVDAIAVTILNDARNENTERFLVVLGNPSNATLLDHVGSAAVQDDDPQPTVNIGPLLVTASEGDAGYRTATFAITLSAASSLPVKVAWASARGTATDLGTSEVDLPDFQNASDEVVFIPGDTSPKLITLRILGDTIIESAEYFFVNLIRADNANIGVNHAIVEIPNDDFGAPLGPWHVQFSDVSYSVIEDAGFAVITLVRAANSSEAVAVLHSFNGTATPDLDYENVVAVVRFASGETEKTILIPIIDDTLIEATETVTLMLRNPTGGAVKGEFKTAILRILDDEPRPSITIDDGVVTEGNGGSSIITFNVHLSAAAEIPIMAHWTTNNRSAIGGFDYATSSGMVMFASHAVTATITIALTSAHNDLIAEPVEEFVVNLSMAHDAVIADHQALGRIIDNDLAPISGRVFLDENSNAYFDSFEHGISGLTVEVTDYAGTLVSVTTNAAGVWNASVLMGATKVHVIETGLPEGLSISSGNNPQTVTISPTVSSAPDVGYAPGFLPAIPPNAIGEGSGGLDDTAFGGAGNDIVNGGGGHDHLVGGQWLLGQGGATAHDPYNVFLQQTGLASRISLAPASLNSGGTISGQAFVDLNNNALRDGGDSPLAAITVNLFDAGYAFVISGVTDAAGHYQFTHLAPGIYFLQFEAPVTHEFVAANAGSDTVDSDASALTGLTASVTVTSSGVTSNVDAGLRFLSGATTGPWLVSFSSSVYNVWEKDGSAQIVIERIPASIHPLAVFYTLDGTAVGGADYIPVFRQLVRIADAALETSITLSVLTDNLPEGLETVLLFLRNPTGGPVHGARPIAVLLIFDSIAPDDDTLTGSHGDDIVLGDHGVVDTAGNATLLGGAGHDELTGSAGFDHLHAQGGNDQLNGGPGNDLLVGGVGDDTYLFDTDSPAGTDLITELAGAGNGLDTLDFSATTGIPVVADLSLTSIQDVSVLGIVKLLRLTLSDGIAIENLIGGGANDTLSGNGLDNAITGGPGSDVMDGRLGTDTLFEQRNVDFVLSDTTLQVVAPNELDTFSNIEAVNLVGGPGDNQFDVSASTGVLEVNLDGDNGIDTIVSSNDSNFVLSDTLLNVSPGAIFGLTSFERAQLTGGVGANTIDAGAFTGSATLIGGAGNDILIGGFGNDTLTGGSGADSISGGGGVDRVIESSDSNMVLTDATLTIGSETDTLNSVEAASLTGGINNNTFDASTFSGVASLFGGDGHDILLGGLGDDLLEGGLGNDTLTGGPGNDTLTGGDGIDVYIFDADSALSTALGHDLIVELPGAPAGVDTLDFSATTGLGVSISLSLSTAQAVNANLTLQLSANNVIENVIGSALDDAISGNQLNNSLTGGLGNDTYFFAASWGVDVVNEPSNISTDTVDFSAVAASPILFSVSATISVTSGANLLSHSGGGLKRFLGGQLNDTFDVVPSLTIPYFIDGGSGSLDTLNFYAFGAPFALTATTITADGHSPVTHAQIEAVNFP